MSREYPCVYYDNQKCKKFEEPGYVSWCVLGPCSHETPSNGDHIRAMSDEGLAEFLDETQRMECEAIHELNEDGSMKFKSLKGGWLEWLQQPAKEDA